MKKIVLRWIGLGLSVTALTSIGMINTQLSAQAETPDDRSNVEASPQLPEEIAKFSRSSTLTSADAFLNAPQQIAIAPAYSATQIEVRSHSNQIASKPTDLDNSAAPQQLQQAKSAANLNAVPVPGSTETSAANLSNQAPVTTQPNQPSVPSSDAEVAQLPVDPGRTTRGGSSYIGIGGNIGLSGDTALGDGNFAIISKIGLTRSLAVRPGVILGSDAIFLIPLTYDFSIRQAEALEEVLPIAPYIGAGVAISTGEDDAEDEDDEDNSGVGLLLTGGVDIPISSQFTANASVNVNIADETDVGLLLGVGYNFSGLGI